jgi:hypothetical protein
VLKGTRLGTQDLAFVIRGAENRSVNLVIEVSAVVLLSGIVWRVAAVRRRREDRRRMRNHLSRVANV